MPVISPYGSNPVAMGFGTISIMGSTPAALVGVTGNNAHWYSSSKIVYQDYTSGAVLKTYDTGTLAVATVDASGGNCVGGGGSIWAAWLAGVGVRTNAPIGPFPAGGSADFSAEPTLVSETGQVLFVTTYATGSGVSCYSALGVQQLNIATTLASTVLNIRQNIVSYQDGSGWHLVNALTGSPVPGFVQRPSITKLTPFTIGSSVGVLEYQSSTAMLTVRLATALTGLTIPTVGTEFNPDVQGVDSTHVRVAWSLTPGEAPDDLIILDIDTATGTTQRGTVVAGSVVFADGPTLDGTTFSGSVAALNNLPVQSQRVLNQQGEMSKPWRDALQRISSSLQSAQTAINVLPTPTTPPDGFGEIGGVQAASPNATLNITSDGTITITPDQATMRLVLSAVGGGAGRMGPPGMDGESSDSWPVPGPIGPQGPTGATGPAGASGNGIPGPRGEDGEDGDSWPTPGPIGPTGPTGAAGAGALLGFQKITATGAGTYTPTSGTSTVIIELQGAGGGSSGITSPGVGLASLGRGGGGGAWLMVRLTTAFSGASYSVGAKGTGGASGNNAGTGGGNTTFTATGGGGTVYTAGGGSGGNNGGSSIAPINFSNAVAGGTATNGDFNVNGAFSQIGLALTSTIAIGGSGGWSHYSDGGTGSSVFAANSTASGTAATGKGGGGGAPCAVGTGGAQAGSDGSDGMIVIWEYA